MDKILFVLSPPKLILISVGKKIKHISFIIIKFLYRKRAGIVIFNTDRITICSYYIQLSIMNMNNVTHPSCKLNSFLLMIQHAQCYVKAIRSGNIFPALLKGMNKANT